MAYQPAPHQAHIKGIESLRFFTENPQTSKPSFNRSQLRLGWSENGSTTDTPPARSGPRSCASAPKRGQPERRHKTQSSPTLDISWDAAPVGIKDNLRNRPEHFLKRHGVQPTSSRTSVETGSSFAPSHRGWPAARHAPSEAEETMSYISENDSRPPTPGPLHKRFGGQAQPPTPPVRHSSGASESSRASLRSGGAYGPACQRPRPGAAGPGPSAESLGWRGGRGSASAASSSSSRPGPHPLASGGRGTPGASSFASSRNSRPTRMAPQSAAGVSSNAPQSPIGQRAAGRRQRVAPGSTLQPEFSDGPPPMTDYAPKPWQRGYRVQHDSSMAAVLRPSRGSFSARSARSDCSNDERHWSGGGGGSDERSLSAGPEQRSRCGSQSIERHRRGDNGGDRGGSVQRSFSAGPEQRLRCGSQSRRSSETEQSSVWEGSTMPSATPWEDRGGDTLAQLREHLARNGVGSRRSDDFSAASEMM